MIWIVLFFSFSLPFAGKRFYLLFDAHLLFPEGFNFLVVVMGQLIDMLNAFDDVSFNEFLIFFANGHDSILYFPDQAMQTLSGVSDFFLTGSFLLPKLDNFIFELLIDREAAIFKLVSIEFRIFEVAHHLFQNDESFLEFFV
jgi:hypothetical protein